MFFAAFLGPILLILIFNATVSVAVIGVLVKHTLKRSRDSIKMLVNITSIFVLFGLTWFFGALTIMKGDEVFQIVFTVLNSFQGFLIFVFFCVLNKEVRLTWAQLLCKKHQTVSLKSKSTENESSHKKLIGKSELFESTFTEELRLSGPKARVTGTFSVHNRHMDELVELDFDEVIDIDVALENPQAHDKNKNIHSSKL